ERAFGLPAPHPEGGPHLAAFTAACQTGRLTDLPRIGDRHIVAPGKNFGKAIRFVQTPKRGSMRMFQLCVCGEPLQPKEQPTPNPTGSEVVLKVLAAGVCHSDLHLADGWFGLGGGKRLSLADRGMKLPVTLGHENVGEVVATGPDAKGVRIGARMLADPWIGCGSCGPCRRGEENLCRAMKSLGVFSNGGYADYILVPHPRYLFEIGDLPPERVAP